MSEPGDDELRRDPLTAYARYRDLLAERDRLRAALQRIADEDYRGPRPWSATYAHQTLGGEG